MKKKLLTCFSGWGKCKHLLRIMKLTVLISLSFVLCVSAGTTYSQTTKLSLKLVNSTVKEVLNQVEEKSDFVFLYKIGELDESKRVNIALENASIREILDQVLKGQNLTYDIYNRQVIIRKVIPDNVQGKQGNNIKGKIADSSGTPLPGVTVLVKGTNQGIITDVDGNYSLENVRGDAILVFSFVGMKTQEIAVAGKTIIDVTMEEETIGIDEIVAVGYSTRRVGEVTGSVSSVRGEELADMTAVQTSELLKGNVSGVTVVESHTPGEGASIRIRGMGTINDNDPLWVVDGVPGAEVNPNNIESISILKDASSQAIYGSRAANGVILVTTKSGKKNQKTQVNIRIKSGVTKSTNSYDLLNTKEYGELLWLMAENDGIDNYTHPQYGSGDEPVIPEYIFPAGASTADYSLYDNQMTHEDGDDTYLIMKANKEGTDWMDEIMQNAFYQEFAIDVTGGSETAAYSFMANYLKEEGILKYTGYERFNIRANSNFNIGKWLEIGEKVEITRDNDYGGQGNYSEVSGISMAFRMQPIVPVYDVMGNFAGTQAPGTGNGTNPVFYLWSNQNDEYKNLTASGNTYAKINLIKGISLKSLFGFIYSSNDNRNITLKEVAHAERSKYDELTQSANFTYQWNWSNLLNYSSTFADLHNVTFILGTEAVHNYYNYQSASRSDFFSTDPNYMQLDAGVQSIQNSGNASEWALFSLFGRLNYNYADKYLIEATVRRDGSSRFGSDNRYGTFPAFSIGWRVTEENFMDFSGNWLNFLKVRVGWGQTGNDRIGNYNGYTNFVSSYGSGWYTHDGSYYPIDGSNTGATAGFQSDSFGNSEVKWETAITSNIGIDATIFDKFGIVIDLWKRRTEDMLFPKQIPYTAGLATAPSVNVGVMDNRGVDFELNYSGHALNQDFKYNIGLNVSHYKNEIKELSGNEDEFLRGAETRNHYYTRAMKGTAYPEFFGYIVEGIFQTEEEAANHPTAFGENGTYNEPGHFKYKNINNDEVINEDDRTFIGSPHPDFTAGLNLNLQYKNLSMTARFYSSYGNEVVNGVNKYIDYNLFQGGRSHKLLYQSWGSPHLKDNKDAVMTKAESSDSGSQEPSTYFVEDASYLRLQSLEVSYDLKDFIPWTEFKNFKIYGQVTNLFTITNYSGLDPEINTSGMDSGMDIGTWPTPRRFMIGLNISF